MSNNKITPLRYIAYVRKSEERKERQELSHPAQINAIKDQFPGLNIVKWMEPESKSAFKPGRPIFQEMLTMIEKGKADAIIAWHPNRLSRNEKDSAEITYMLRGALKDLRFCSYNFDNSAEGIMMLQMVMNQSQYESSKQGRDVKRGMAQKAANGERPGIVPTGYMKVPLKATDGNYVMNKDKIVTQTDVDPERVVLVKRMWKMLLSGIYSPPEIRRMANEEWSYTLRPTRHTGGGPLGLSSIYRLFNNPFYAGYIRYKGELYKGNHEAIIGLEDFDYAQQLLGRKGKPRAGVNGYAFTGLIKCGACGCSIVGKTNSKFVKREGRMVTYVHYHCTRKSEDRPCTQGNYTKLEALEREIDAELAKYTILPEFRDMALEILNRNHKIEIKERTKIYDTQQSRRGQIQKQLDSLIDMRTRNLLDDDEYTTQRARLKDTLLRVDEGLRSTEERAESWMELTEQAFNFATYARIKFRNGDLKAKRDILMSLGTNLTLKDQKLSLEPNEWLLPIGLKYPELEKEYLSKVRTNEKASLEGKEEALSQIYDSWRAIVDAVAARINSSPRIHLTALAQ